MKFVLAGGSGQVGTPHPLPNRDFMRALRAAAGVRIGLPATKLMVDAVAVLMRAESELILKSRRVVPGLLLGRGFAFPLSHWPAAARQLCDERLAVAR